VERSETDVSQAVIGTASCVVSPSGAIDRSDKEENGYDRSLANEDAAPDRTFRCPSSLQRERNPMAAHLAPEEGDVVVRPKRGNPSTVYLPGTDRTDEPVAKVVQTGEPSSNA